MFGSSSFEIIGLIDNSQQPPQPGQDFNMVRLVVSTVQSQSQNQTWLACLTLVQSQISQGPEQKGYLKTPFQYKSFSKVSTKVSFNIFKKGR